MLINKDGGIDSVCEILEELIDMTLMTVLKCPKVQCKSPLLLSRRRFLRKGVSMDCVRDFL